MTIIEFTCTALLGAGLLALSWLAWSSAVAAEKLMERIKRESVEWS